MTRRLLLSYLSITAFVLLILEVPLAITFARSERDHLTADLERDARVLASFADDALEAGEPDPLQAIVDQYEERTGGRAVVVNRTGASVADSDGSRPLGRPFRSRPEIDQALQGSQSSIIRQSDDLGGRYLFVAVPVASSGEVLGAVRVSFPTERIDARVRRNQLSLAALTVTVLGAVAIVGTLLARSVSKPLRSLAGASQRLAAGELDARADADSGPPEVRALAAQFNAMAAQIESLVQAQRTFVADASHELRTPLTALGLRLENLRHADADEIAGQIEAVNAEAQRLADLVEGLLALARAEGRPPALGPVDLGAVATERVEMWDALAAEQGVTLQGPDGPPAVVVAARNAVEQVLDNYLANALDVAPRGSTISVTTGREGAFGVVHVVDEGPGLDAEARARAFDRFWRAPDARPGGTGLGLAIAAQQARACGGDVALRAATPHGVDAVARFPLGEALGRDARGSTA